MSSLFYNNLVQTALVDWKLKLNSFSILIDQLEKELKTIQDPADRKLFEARLDILADNYNSQIALINELYSYIETCTVSVDRLSYTKQKLDIARKFIRSLGGDPNSLNWLKASDFY